MCSSNIVTWAMMILGMISNVSHSPIVNSEQWNCAHELCLEHQLLSQAEKIRDFENGYLESMRGTQQMAAAGGAFILPVVFHVVHNGGPENLSDNLVMDALNMLNESFANTGYYNPQTGVDTEIQFCLATQDPQGNTTNGITRVRSALTNFNYNTQDIQMKDLSRWDPTSYVNIYIVNEISSNQGSGVAGYAYFPTSHGSPEDGIVVEARYTGQAFSDNSILTHEMGHYLGLYHTFQGGCPNNDCMTDGDRVCDTPPDGTTARPPCDQPNNSCNTDTDSGFPSDVADMIINYMDYSDLACYSAFTNGQKDRMCYTIDVIRKSLLSSKGCQDPCPVNIVADASVSGDFLFVGDQIFFTDQSINATTYKWIINGMELSNSADFNYIFPKKGEYVVELKVEGDQPECIDRKEWRYLITCEAKADFRVNESELEEGDDLITQNLSSNANSYMWFLDGVLVSNSRDFTRTMNIAGVFELVLVVTNGACSDTSTTTLITVVPPGLVRTGLPGWPLLKTEDGSVHLLDWRGSSPIQKRLTTSNQQSFVGQSGAGYDECGGLKFVVVHNGSSDPNGLYAYDKNGQPVWDNAINSPGMNAVRGGNEIQVVPVPNRPSEWYIIYNEYQPDAGWPINNAGYAPCHILYSHVAMRGNQLVVMARDQMLLADGRVQTYTDGKAVSRTANGRSDQHFLYATRRSWRSNVLSLDRFLITENGISFDANTGNVSAQWWDLSMAGSPVELSPTEHKIAVVNRNQSSFFNDVIIFDAANFTSAGAQIMSLGELRLQPDGAPRDQSSILNREVVVRDARISTPASNLDFLANLERKVSGVEFSPNGRFLYFVNGGFVSGRFTNITYLGQIDLESTYPYELRLQIQQVPINNHNTTTGRGCEFTTSQACNDAYQSIVHIESCFDGNLYFTKRTDSTFYVIPDPNNFMPQNLIPSNIDLSNANEKNVDVSFRTALIPDQIDGFNYLNFQKKEVELIVQKLDCDSLCAAPYILQLVREDSVVIESVQIARCPDTLIFCIDTNYSYFLRDTLIDTMILTVLDGGVVTDTLFDFSKLENCVEICGNGIDDDGDGLIDCDDPDIEDDCCCLEPEGFNLGPDREVCDNGVFIIEGPLGYIEYRWQDGFTERVYTAYEPGEYILTAIDSCDNEFSDTIVIRLIPESELDLPDQYDLCEGDSLTFQIGQFDSWSWSPSAGLSCSDCPVIYAKPDSAMSYIITAEYGQGCFTLDTIMIDFLESPESNDTLSICEGDTLIYEGEIIVNSGNFTFMVEVPGSCDSIIRLHVMNSGSIVEYDTVKVCVGDSAFYDNNGYGPGEYEIINPSQESCDSILYLTVENYDTTSFSLTSDSICPQSIDGVVRLTFEGGPQIQQIGWSNGMTGVEEINDLPSGKYRVEILNEYGCISDKWIDVSEYPVPEPDFDLEHPICANDSTGNLILRPAGFSSISINQGPFAPLRGSMEIEVGRHTLTFQSEEGCLVDTTLVVTSATDFQAWLIDTLSIHFGDSIQLQLNIDPPGNYQIEWEPCTNLSCCDCPNPIFSGLKSQRLWVTVTDVQGCEKLLSVFIEVLLDKKVWGPNVFSPNDDGLNDRFTLFGNQDVSELVILEIYDRWGELVYRGTNLEPNNLSQGWDGMFLGEPMNPAVFAYISKVRFIDGSENWLTGSLTLMR